MCRAGEHQLLSISEIHRVAELKMLLIPSTDKVVLQGTSSCVIQFLNILTGNVFEIHFSLFL